MQHGVRLLAELFHHIGVHHAWCNGVDPNAAVCHFLRQRTRKGINGALYATSQEAG